MRLHYYVGKTPTFAVVGRTPVSVGQWTAFVCVRNTSLLLQVHPEMSSGSSPLGFLHESYQEPSLLISSLGPPLTTSN